MRLMSRSRHILGRAALALAMGVFLAACDPKAISELEEGVSTEADVRARFGPPEVVWEGDDGAVIVADVGHERRPPEPGVVTHEIKVRVTDVEAVIARARAYGATVVQEPVEYEYGEREATVEDLAGHRWQFTQTFRDVAPTEWGGVTVEP